MPLHHRVSIAFVLSAGLIGYGQAPASPSRSQSACGTAPVVALSTQPNIFSPQQEAWLGEAMADLIEADYRPARDASQNLYLQSIADKLATTLPPSQFPYRIQIIDSSEVNGFSIAGGRIFITRKLASVAANEDEIAAVIGHEMGHIASHQFAFEATRELKRLLGVTSVGDRADVYTKFHALLDARMNDKHPVKEKDDDAQDEADDIGVFAVAAAGYRPQASAEFWDRVFFVGGKTGSKLSDFFGITKPTQKRLRGMQRMVAALPVGCGASAPNVSSEFTRWQRSVVANQQVLAQANEKPLQEVALTPPLRMDLDRLRFSHDGKFILAQDEASVFVLTAGTLAVKFRFDAEDALSAEFSPDSGRIVFMTPGLHTEEWDLSGEKLISAREVLSRHRCIQPLLSPDGRTIVCISLDPAEFADFTLSLLDVSTGATVWEKKDMFSGTYEFMLQLAFSRADERSINLFDMSLSADGNIVMIGPSSLKQAFDLRTRTPIKVVGDLRDKVNGSYAFVGNDKVVGRNRSDNKDSGVYSFPDGKRLQKISLGVDGLQTVANPGNDIVVISTGIPTYGIGMINFTTQQFSGLKSSAMDVSAGSIVAEAEDGGISLIPVASSGDAKTQKHLMLPLSPLGRLRSVSVSPDGRYLTLSARSHSGVWDLTTGTRLSSMRGYNAARWLPGDVLILDFPRLGKAKPKEEDKTKADKVKATDDKPKVKDRDDREVLRIDAPHRLGADVTYEITDKMHLDYGRLMEWKPGVKPSVDLIVRNPGNGNVLWTRTFSDGRPYFTGSGESGSGELIFSHSLSIGLAKDALKASPTLAAELASSKDKANTRLIEIVDDTSGKTTAQMLLTRPLDYEGVDGINRVGGLLYVSGGANRTLVYALATGKQLRQEFGYVIASDAATGRICLVNRRDEAIVYDAEGKELAHFRMGNALRYARFQQNGTRLIVLTADQRVRTMSIDTMTAAAN